MPEPEWNIKSDAKAAQVVFASGMPPLVAPLDSTADLKLTPEWLVRIFAQGSPLNDALASLDFIWKRTNTWKAENQTLFDNLAVGAGRHPGPRPACADAPRRRGRRPHASSRTARPTPVALTTDPAAFLQYFLQRLDR